MTLAEITPYPTSTSEKPPFGLEPKTCGLQNRSQDDVNQCYFRFYDDPQKRLGAALAHIGATDPDLAKLLHSWPYLPARFRTALAAYAFIASQHSRG